MSQIPKILGERRWRGIALVALTGIAQAAATGLAAFAVRDLFASLRGDAPASVEALAMLGAGGILVALARVLERAAAEGLGHSYAISLRRALYRHLARMSQSHVAERRAGALGLRFVGDLSAARNWVGLGLTRILSSIFVIPGAAIALWLLNPTLAMAAIVPIAVSLVLMAALSVLLEGIHSRLRAKRGGIAISMMERVAVAPELDLMARTGKEVRRLDAQGVELRERSQRRMSMRTAISAVPEIGAALAAVALLWMAAQTGAPASDAAAMLAVIGILSLPLRELGGIWDRRCAWAIARRKCEMVFAKPHRPRRKAARSGPVPVVASGVEFRSIQFDFALAPGEIAVINGETGAGKSSLLSLVAGLEHPEAGEIGFGGDDVWPLIAYVGPRSPILQGSLRRALTLGVSPRPDDDEIRAVGEEFGLSVLIDRLGGLGGRVGEGGRTLSDGERLRVHAARAALSKADLMIVDAPGLAADGKLAIALAKTARDAGATVLVAAPAGPLEKFADRRFVIKCGALRERGKLSIATAS